MRHLFISTHFITTPIIFYVALWVAYFLAPAVGRKNAEVYISISGASVRLLKALPIVEYFKVFY